MTRAAVVRWGWLLTTVASGLALLATAWANSNSARQAAGDVMRSEAYSHRNAVLAAEGPGGERLVDLDSLVQSQRETGLHYVAWVFPDGTVSRSGGRADVTPFDLPDSSARSPKFERLSQRVRVYFPPPPRIRLPEAPSGGPARGGPPTLVLEFEPLVAARMVERAEQALLVAGLVALILTSAGLAFWRLSSRIEASRRRLEAQRRLLALGEMSAVLAHEIRNPLASLKGHAQLLTERLPPGSRERRKASRVVDEAKRLEALTTDLLDFVRSGPIDLQPVDPVALLRDAAAEVANGAIAVEGSGAPERWTLDARRFQQAVLVNLLRNAMQASPPDRPPQARVTLQGGRLVFTIRDHGSGLPGGQEHRIFDPFFTTRTMGTGLGLAVARRIVELHGGRIAAADATDGEGGAVFTVELPRVG